MILFLVCNGSFFVLLGDSVSVVCWMFLGVEVWLAVCCFRLFRSYLSVFSF